MFRTTNNKGFQVTFPNGLTLSTQFGRGNYCENRMKQLTGDAQSKNCEIAIIDESGAWRTREILDTIEEVDLAGTDDVEGYLNISEWLLILNKVANYKP